MGVSASCRKNSHCRAAMESLPSLPDVWRPASPWWGMLSACKCQGVLHLDSFTFSAWREFVNCKSLAFAHAELCDWSALDSSLESVSTAGPHVSRSAKFRKSMAQTCSEDNQNWWCSCWVELFVFQNALKWTKGRKHLPKVKVFVLFVRIPACHVSLPVRCWLKTIWLFLTGHLFKWQAELDLLVAVACLLYADLPLLKCKLLQVSVFRIKRSKSQVDPYHPCR